MYLKDLEINGFKSFAKKATLHFKTPITSIVGPNGSGKSNVAEAFRFVLGEQSIKSMRGKRGEDLIFNGSGEMGRLNRAAVKVTFDNTRRMLNVDFDEVAIERVVHRDSSNEYLINGSQVRLKDIIELLAGAHVGASGHHIISQGEADKILNANIRERREMIEDALGLKIYQYKKLESQRKLEKTEENIKSVESLRREIVPHLKFLKKQVEKIEKVYELKNSLRLLYKEYFKREEAYLAHERAVIEHEMRGPVHEQKTLEEELAKAKDILAAAKGADAKSHEIISLEDKLRLSRLERDSLTRDTGRIEGEISSIERLIKKEKERTQNEEQKTVYLRDVESLIRRVDVEIDEASSKESVLDVRSILVRIREICASFVRDNRSADNSTSVADAERDISNLREEKAVIEDKIRSIDSVITELNNAYSSLRQEIEREKDSNRDAEKNVFRIMAKQNEIRSVLNTLKGREERLVLEEEAFKRELVEAHVVAGREAVDFHAFNLLNEHGQSVSADEMAREDRHMQEDRRRSVEKLKIRIEDSGASNGDDVMKEYREVEERDTFLARELEDLRRSAESLEQLIAELDVRLDKEFKEGILKINVAFSQFFVLMFGGGSAELSVVKEKKKRRKDTDLGALLSDDPSAYSEMEMTEEDGPEGVEIAVTLPRKKIKGLEMLSGGERALTSIALLFAISQVNPPPFIILDETDAALDEANSRKYGDMIENLSKYSQLILITHNRETMSRAGVLYGVTMGADGGSKLLSIEFEQANSYAK